MVMVMVMMDEEQQTRIYLFNSHENFGKGNGHALRQQPGWLWLAGRYSKGSGKESRSSGASGGRCVLPRIGRCLLPQRVSGRRAHALRQYKRAASIAKAGGVLVRGAVRNDTFIAQRRRQWAKYIYSDPLPWMAPSSRQKSRRSAGKVDTLAPGFPPYLLIQLRHRQPILP